MATSAQIERAAPSALIVVTDRALERATEAASKHIAPSGPNDLGDVRDAVIDALRACGLVIVRAEARIAAAPTPEDHERGIEAAADALLESNRKPMTNVERASAIIRAYIATTWGADG